MADPETVKVVSSNPDHTQGFILKNLEDLLEGDVLFGFGEDTNHDGEIKLPADEQPSEAHPSDEQPEAPSPTE